MNSTNKELFNQLSTLLTEQRNPDTQTIDLANSLEIEHQLIRKTRK
jgi:hypothetical protein